MIVSFAVPLALASFMGFLTGGSRDKGDSGKIDVLMTDLDQNPVSAEVVSNLTGDATVTVKQVTLEQARAQVLAGKVPVASVLPKGFGRDSGRAFFGTAPKPEVGLCSPIPRTAPKWRWSAESSPST